MNDLLQCTGVQCRFGDFVATRGIDLSVRESEVIGIIFSLWRPGKDARRRP